MRLKARLFSLTKPASDGSIISESVLNQYLASEDYQKAIENRSMLGTLTHRLRSLENAPADIKTGALTKTIGKDDLIVFTPEIGAPTHYIERLYIEDDWCMCDIKVLDENEYTDSKSKEYIGRLKSLLLNGCKLSLSLVIVSFWSGTSNGADICKKINSVKGCDFTQNPSWKGASVVEAYSDEGEKLFSNTQEGVKVKTFSNTSDLVEAGTPKSSKIDGTYCILKGKVFSNFAEVQTIEQEEQKEFSVSAIKERTRFAKYPPRQRFRRLVMEYKQAVRSMGGDKMDPETEKVMKSLFCSDLLDILKTITPDIMKGKQIGTLLGASSLGKNTRVIAQKLQMPLRQSLIQLEKQGYVTKNFFEKTQTLYGEFVKEMTNEVFSSKSTIPDLKEEDKDMVNEKEAE